MDDLRVDPARTINAIQRTGICVRAKTTNGHWVSADIATLTPESIVRWLRDKQSQNPEYAIQCVLAILRY